MVSSTSAPGYVVDYDMIVQARKSRRGREQFYIDLAVPRDIDPRALGLDGVFVYNIDGLSQVVPQPPTRRDGIGTRLAPVADPDLERLGLGVHRRQDSVASRRRTAGRMPPCS